MPPIPVIFGCSGTALTADEQALFRETQPFGFILFARNCETPAQLRQLTGALRATVDHADPPVLIDQEGGRVQRLKPPQWPDIPAAARFGALARVDAVAARRACWLNGRLMAAQLRALGITVNCVPCLDLRRPETHQAIGDRAFDGDPGTVAELGRAQAEGLMAGAVLPVIKHMPGQGRATVDSHHHLPLVDAPAAELEQSDFVPFARLADLPLAITGHVVFSAIDADAPATQSRTVIDTVIRGRLGFAGLLLSDDLDMQALSGDRGTRARRALEAGCDVVLQCNGELAAMRSAAAGRSAMPDSSWRRWRTAAAMLAATPADVDAQALSQERDALLAGA